MEERFEVRPYGVKYTCDYCNKGEMLPTGKNNWSTDLPQIEHWCDKCNYKVDLSEKYPLIRYETSSK